MRHTRILIILVCLMESLASAGQVIDAGNADITGLWKGTLYNDTNKLTYRYEIAISEDKKGKLTGFSHTWFILDDQQFYGVKKLKIKRDGNKVITEDAGLVAHNYPVAPAKGVRQLNVLTLELTDKKMILSGPFATNQTREYSPLTGTIMVERRNDYRQSSLVPHLQELGLEKSLSFVEPITEDLTTSTGVRGSGVTVIVHGKIAALPSDSSEEQKALVRRSEDLRLRTNENKAEPPADIKKKEIPVADVSPTITKVAQKTDEQPMPDTRREDQVQAKAGIVKKESPVKPAAAEAFSRQTIQQQVVTVKSDSLQLSLYDNGEVDGDTVSVLLNGVVVMERQGLSTRAIRKTVSLPAGVDSVMLLMYAESLGSIPPNTGLLVIKDGQEQYEVRFSGDLQKNAGILLRRKKTGKE